MARSGQSLLVIGARGRQGPAGGRQRRAGWVFLGEGERQTVTMTLGGQIGQVGGRGWQAVSGSALIALSVPVLVFIVLQRYFIRGLTAAAVNG